MHFSKVYFPTVYFCEVYLTCVSSKLCEFIYGYPTLPLSALNPTPTFLIMAQANPNANASKILNRNYILSVACRAE